MQRTFRWVHWPLMIGLFGAIICSCQKNVNPGKPVSTVRLPANEKEKELVENIKKIELVLRKIYTDPAVTAEVNAAIKCGYYGEEAVKLYDLLHPESSLLYRSEKFKNLKVKSGAFNARFEEAIGGTVADGASQRSGADYFKDHGITIYFPYSEDFTNPRGSEITLVAADRDADEGPGNKPNGTNADGSTRYVQVTVDDDYAAVSPTHIIGVVDKFLDDESIDSLPPPAGTVDRVFHGYSRLANNYDKLISFSGNGGSSDMKIARISGYLQVQSQHVANFTGDVVSVDYSRRNVKKKIWKRVYSVWDPDWTTANNEQVYAVWEEDTEGDKTFTGSLSTTLLLNAFDSTQTVQGNIGFSVSVRTQDEVLTQRKISRYAYFRTATQDQGGGFNMCYSFCGGGSANPCMDNTFLASGYWPIWDCGTDWKYLWPYRIY